MPQLAHAVNPRKGQPRPQEWAKPGRKRGQKATIRTRLGHLCAKIARLAPGKLVRLPLDSAAATLECNRNYLRSQTMNLREGAWFFKATHTVILLTYEMDDDAAKGRWVLWCINRHSLHRIFAAPGKWRQLRWHLRQGDRGAWNWYGQRIWKWAQAMIQGKKRRQAEHKGFSPATSRARPGGGRAPPERKRALRRFGGLAADLSASFNTKHAPLAISLHGWTVNRLSEWHSRASIALALDHAATLLEKRRRYPLDNPAGWLCGVAERRLASDGFTPKQRQRSLQLESWAHTRPAEGKAFNDCESESAPPMPTGFVGRNCFEPGPTPIWVDGNGQRWLCSVDGTKTLL